MNFKQKKGFTLIESMIAIVVFSFGLLGVAGVMTVAVKNNHNGYMRSQATVLTATIIDMMRRNQPGLKLGSYNGSYTGYSDISALCTSSACNSVALAARDVQQWSNLITQLLPNSSGNIACVEFGTETWGVAPYNGICNVTVSWTEANEIDASSIQSITLTATP